MFYIEDLTKIHRLRAQVRRVNHPGETVMPLGRAMTGSRKSWPPFFKLRGKYVGLSEPVIGPKNPLLTAVETI